MPNMKRVVEGRDQWKRLAVERRKEAESKARQAEKWKSRYLQKQAELEQQKQKIKELETELEKKNSTRRCSN